jgi:hypothetical protein
MHINDRVKEPAEQRYSLAYDNENDDWMILERTVSGRTRTETVIARFDMRQKFRAEEYLAYLSNN